jgi:hypothetical protein
VSYAAGPNAPNKSVPWSVFNPYNAAGYGHQLQPTLTFAAGKLTLFWLDQRLDHTAGRLDCSQAPAANNLSQCTEVRDQRPSAGTDPVPLVFTDSISDGPGLHFRHTLDVFGGQALPADNPVFAVTRVSQYPFGSPGGDAARSSKPIRQLQVNPPDLPLFAGGTTPFLGDYLDVVAQSIVSTGNGHYAWNTSPANSAVFHAAWSDNRDVIPPADGVSWNKYAPIMTIGLDGASVTVNPLCLPGYAGSQNQNIYTAEISGGIDAYAVVNSKQLTTTAPRQFSVVVENLTGSTKTVSLSIANQPVGGSATFDLQSPSPLTSISSVAIYPSSSITRTVWVTSSNPGATVTVNINDAGGNLIAAVLLNPDPNATTATAPPAPTGGDAVSINQSNITVLSTSLSNTSLTNVDVGLVDPSTVDLTANTINSMDLGNMDLGNMDLGNMDLGNMDLGNMDLGNMDLGNMDLGNMDLGNASVAANAPTFMDLGNAGMVDTSFLLFNNTSSTDVSLDLKTLFRGTRIPPGYKAQLFVHKIYPTQTVSGGNSCSYAKVSQKIPLVNAPGPTVTPTMDLGNSSITETWISNTDPTNATIALLPGEVGHVTYRLVGNGTSNQNQNQQGAVELGNNGVKVVAINQTTTVIPIPLAITTLTLPDANAGSGYSATITSSGGLAPVTWTNPANGANSICPAGSVAGLPTGMILSSAGLLTGTASVPGLYCFVAQVTDSTAAPRTETDIQTLTLTVHGTQSVALPSGPLVYGSSMALPASSGAGLAVSYSVSAGPCSISGTTLTAIAGTGSCTISATNSGNAVFLPLSSSQTITLNPAALNVAANNTPMAYGGPLPAFSATFTGLVNNDSSTFLGTLTFTTTATASSPVGSYPITPGGLSSMNYIITYAGGTLTISPATLTVTAVSTGKVFGDPLPVFSVTYSGFVLGQNASVLGGTLVFSTPATVSSPVGIYPVTPAGLTSTNYAIASVAGTLTVTKATPVFGNLSSPTVAAGSAIPPLGGKIGYAGFFPTGSVSVTVNAIAAAAPISVSDGSFAASFGGALVSEGAYTISFSYEGDSNFTPANASGTLHVGGWTVTASMSTPRSQFAVALLQSGKVLMAGGVDDLGRPLASGEVYDPVARTFTNTVNNMPNKATNFTATLLGNGSVLLAGGGNASAQLYNPTTNSFAATGGMSSQRSNHTATLLPNGQVLIAGGSNNAGSAQNTAQLFDPATGNFKATGNMTAAREYHTATLLANGKVLIAGGRTGSKGSYSFLTSVEIYDPAAGVFTAAGNMSAARYGHTAAFVNGMVLIAGGANSAALSSAELYDPAHGTFTPAPSMSAARQFFTATAVNGNILEAGGSSGSTALASTEQFQAGAFASTGSMRFARYAHTATLLNNGSVLVAGGIGVGGASIAAAELFVVP